MFACSRMWFSVLQSLTYSRKCWEVKTTCHKLMSLIHVLLCKALLIVLFLFFEMRKRFGAISWGLWPWSQALVQKEAVKPSPTVIDVAAATRSLSVVWHGMSGLFIALPSPSHSFHNHLRRSALANFPRWSIPRPPDSVGLVERDQLTLHFPPVSFSDPAQRKLFLRLSISFSVALGALSDVRQYTTCEVRTALTKVDLPAWLIFLPFHTVSLLTALSTRG